MVGKDVSDGVNRRDPSKMVLLRDDYTSLQLGKTYYHVIAKNESGASAAFNVISVKRPKENLAPVVTLSDALTITHSG